MGSKNDFRCCGSGLDVWSRVIGILQIIFCGAAMALYAGEIIYNVLDVGQFEGPEEIFKLSLVQETGQSEKLSSKKPTSTEDENELAHGAAMVIVILLFLRFLAGVILGALLLRAIHEKSEKKLRWWLVYQFIIFVLGLMLLFMQAALHYHRHDDDEILESDTNTSGQETELRDDMALVGLVKFVLVTAPTILNIVALWIVSGHQRELEEGSYLVPLIPHPKFAGIRINEKGLIYL